MVKRGIVIGAATLVAIVLAIGGASEPVEAPEANVAECDSPVRGVAPGPADWPHGSVVAGPVTIGATPLRTMTKGRNGQLYAKTDILVRGHQYVVLSVPLALRDRVFLYFGRIEDAAGRPAASLFAAPGYSETEFQPCPGRRHTLWPGGVRVVGRAPVNLLVTIEGHPRSLPLSLGEPQILQRR